MTDVRLFPRLTPSRARGLVSLLKIPGNVRIDQLAQQADPFVTWPGSGGRRVRPDELQLIRESLLQIARDSNFPRRATQAQKASFDAQSSAWLIESGLLPVGEALRDDVWTYICTCTVPDLCLWRFDSATPERFIGGIRNTLQRLWIRGRAFDRGATSTQRWELLWALTEDAMVQITERPSLGASSRVALAIAEAWYATAARVGAAKMEDLTRTAVRNIRIANEVLYLSALPDDALRSAILGHFTAAEVSQGQRLAL
jgi:hypothetical protein